MKKYSTALVMREMEIKTAVRYHFISSSTAIIKKTVTNILQDIETLNPLHIAVENMSAATSENSLVFPQIVKHKLPYDRAIPLVGINPREIKMYVHTKMYTLMFVVALFRIAKG